MAVVGFSVVASSRTVRPRVPRDEPRDMNASGTVYALGKPLWSRAGVGHTHTHTHGHARARQPSSELSLPRTGTGSVFGPRHLGASGRTWTPPLRRKECPCPWPPPPASSGARDECRPHRENFAWTETEGPLGGIWTLSSGPASTACSGDCAPPRCHPWYVSWGPRSANRSLKRSRRSIRGPPSRGQESDLDAKEQTCQSESNRALHSIRDGT